MKRVKILFWIELAGWAAVSILIVVLSLITGPVLRPVAAVGDKTAHLLAYLVLGFISFPAFGRLPIPRGPERLYTALWALLYCSIIGGSLELLQGLTGRQPDVFDFLADIAGAFIGISLSWIILRAYQLFSFRAPRGGRRNGSE